MVRAWQTERFTILTSEHIITTLDAKPAGVDLVRRISFLTAASQTFVTLLCTQAVTIAIPAVMVVPVTGDPEDDAVLATAHLGRADYLVTGDRRLLEMGTYDEVRILRPRDFLGILEESTTA